MSARKNVTSRKSGKNMLFLHFAVFGIPGDPIVPPEILYCLTVYVVVICRPKLLIMTKNT